MKNKYLIAVLSISMHFGMMAQNQTQGVSIANTEVPPSQNAILDVVSSAKGVLIPRVDYSDIEQNGILGEPNIIAGEDGLMVFVTTPGANYGYWYFEFFSPFADPKGRWVKLATGNGNLWSENGSGDIYNTALNNKVGIGTNSPTERLSVLGGGFSVKRDASVNISVEITAPYDVNGGHLNEINCDQAPLDLQFSNGQGVRIGSSLAGSDLRVYGRVYHQGLSVFGSDSTLKENITPIRSALNLGAYDSNSNLLSMLNQIQLYRYNYKSDLDDTKTYGVIAQEVKTIFPSLVLTDSYSVNKGGDNITTTKMAFNYQGLSILLLEAIKEQYLIMQDKENQIANLTNRVNTLETQMADLISRVEVLENN